MLHLMLQKHLSNCAVCQGHAAEPRDVFGSYLIAEQGETGVFMPERQDNEAKLGARAGAAASRASGELHSCPGARLRASFS